ncbi:MULTISPECIES: glycosyltransferase family 4 protein [Bacillus]|uniref:glycosyltransferase family 4 protein n=2 Tax=Bacillaceae TaxID=186817 RepID=UPI000EA07886|nr:MULTISPECIES: glycosyltransferase family 4 protein [Bacillus]AYF09189.1 glycosyltransferase [Bacillus mobilis]HDX9571751.1 glycosyltransferase family 4 protein [Bacillus mobilis]
MKKILVIGPVPPPIHGESVAINSIIQSADIKRKYNVNILDTNRKNVKKAGKFSVGKILNDLFLIVKLFKILLFSKIDIMYLSISQTKLGLIRDLIMLVLGNHFCQKTVTHLHGNNLGHVLDNLSNREFRFAKKVLGNVSVGIVLEKSLISNYRGLVKCVEIVPNGIDENFIKEEEKSTYQKNDYFRIVYLSNLMKEKGYIELVKAVMDLTKEGYKLKLDLAGGIHDQEEFNEIWRCIEEKNLNAFITYKGIVTGQEKKELLLKSHVMILPSNYPIEGQPISIIEGMAAGLPIISTNRGAIPDLVEDNGIIIEQGNIESIKQSILKLINDKDLLDRYASNSRLRFQREYTMKQYIGKIIQILDRN